MSKHDRATSLVLFDAEDGANVRKIEGRSGYRFAEETGAKAGPGEAFSVRLDANSSKTACAVIQLRPTRKWRPAFRGFQLTGGSGKKQFALSVAARGAIWLHFWHGTRRSRRCC